MSDRVALPRLKEAVNPDLIGTFGGRSVVTMPREEFEVVHGAARSFLSAPTARFDGASALSSELTEVTLILSRDEAREFTRLHLGTRVTLVPVETQ